MKILKGYNQKKWCLIVFTLTFALLLSEGLIRIISPFKISQSLVVRDEMLGYLHEKNVNTKFLSEDKFISIHTNNMGLRQNDDVKEKEMGEFRILMLGDSTLFGWGVNFQDTFFHLLEKKIHAEYPDRRITLLNGGHGGWGQQQMVGFTELHGLALKPDLIIMVMGPNDIEDNQKVSVYTFIDSKREDIALRGIGQSKEKTKVTPLLTLYNWFLFNSALFQLTRLPAIALTQKFNILKSKFYYSKLVSTHIPSLKPVAVPYNHYEGFDITYSLFRRLKKMANDSNSSLLITNIGHASFRTFCFYENDFFEKEKIDYVDMYPFISKIVSVENSPYFFKGDNHYNKEGNIFYFEKLWPKIKGYVHAALTKHDGSSKIGSL